jgi:hypothetical protein
MATVQGADLGEVIVDGGESAKSINAGIIRKAQGGADPGRGIAGYRLGGGPATRYATSAARVSVSGTSSSDTG